MPPTKRNLSSVLDESKCENEEEYEVEAIVAEKRTKTGVNKYLVKWKGYEKTNWEPEANLLNAKVLIAAFHRNKKKETTKNAIELEGSERDDVEDQEEEYVFNKIIEMKVCRGTKSFLIKWEGYEELSWEPESHLDVETLRIFEAERVKSAVCFFCKIADGAVARYCYTCGKTMHHFCAIDACPNMKIFDGGAILEEFPGDQSYCSRACYFGKAQKQQKRKRIADATDLPGDEAFPSQDEDDEDHEDHVSDVIPDGVRSKKKKKKKKKKIIIKLN